MAGSGQRSKIDKASQNNKLQAGGSRTLPHGILGKNRRKQKRDNGSASTAPQFGELSLSVLHGLEKAIYAHATSRPAGSEARGEGRERGNLIEINFELLGFKLSASCICAPT